MQSHFQVKHQFQANITRVLDFVFVSAKASYKPRYSWTYQNVISGQVSKVFGEHMQRKEAVALFTELVAKGYVQPNLVSIEQRKPERFQLKIKGAYDCNPIELFLKTKGFSYEENQDCLTIFKP